MTQPLDVPVVEVMMAVVVVLVIVVMAQCADLCGEIVVVVVAKLVAS